MPVITHAHSSGQGSEAEDLTTLYSAVANFLVAFHIFHLAGIISGLLASQKTLVAFDLLVIHTGKILIGT